MSFDGHSVVEGRGVCVLKLEKWSFDFHSIIVWEWRLEFGKVKSLNN